MFPSYSQPKPVAQKIPRKPKPDSIAYPLSYSHDIEPEHFRGYEILVTIATGIIVMISLWPMFSKAASADSAPVPRSEVPEFCAGGLEQVQYSGKFVWKTGKPLKVKIGTEARSPAQVKKAGKVPPPPIAHIFDRTGKCYAVCRPSPTSQAIKNPSSVDGGYDFQCSSAPESPDSIEFASHAVIAPSISYAPAVYKTPVIRFGTYLKGYSEAILQADARSTDEPVLAGN